MKKGPFKLKSGNKPSMAQLSGVSPMKEMVDKGAGKGKVNPFSAEYKRMTKSQRRKKYNTRNEDGSYDKEKDTFKKIGSGKTGKIGNIGTALQNIVKSVTGDKKSFKAVTFKGKQGDKFTYRTLEGGGYEFMRPGSTEFEKATKKGNKAIDELFKNR